jgi:hypothetical protein
MRYLVALLVLFIPSHAAAQAPEQQVLEVVERLFDGMRGADTTVMRSTLHPDARLIATGTRDGGPVVREVPLSQWLGFVASSESVLDERLHEPEVRVADGLASVWTFYTFEVDGELSHCGFDAFQLAMTPDGWQITQIADTRQEESCWVPEES